MKRYQVVILSLLLIIALLDYQGVIWHNWLFTTGYEVQGLDVSHHQGKIDWEKVRDTDKYQFVYTKATEGNDFVDDQFSYNWKEAKKRGFLTGAYHFFTMGSSGKEQAQNFIKTVPKDKNSLPSVVDIEIPVYLEKKKVKENLQSLVATLEQHYHQRPILYVTYDTYNAYIKSQFLGYEIWIRDIYKYPTLGERKWLLWQYSNRGRVEGIHKFVDINVFRGTLADLKRLSITRTLNN